MDSDHEDTTETTDSSFFGTQLHFKIKEKIMSMSGDSYDILDPGDRICYKVKGKFWTKTEKKTIFDRDGRPIYRLSEDVFTMHARQTIVDVLSGETIVTIARKSIVPSRGTSTIHIWRGTNTQVDPWLVCRGDLMRKRFFIDEKANGRTVAMVTRGVFNVRNLLLCKSTYHAHLALGSNIPFFMMLIIAIDETYADYASWTNAGAA